MPDGPTAENLVALGQQVRAARLAAGISIDDAADTAGMSPVTWARVEKGQTVRALTYSAIERVLRWRSGSIDAVLQGGEVVLQDDDGVRPGDEARAGDEDLTVADTGPGDVAIAVLRGVAEILKSNLPDRMKLKIIQREVDEAHSLLAAWPHRADQKLRHATG